MGAFRKNIRSGVSRAARLVIDKYYLENHGRPLSKKKLNALVRQAERGAVPLIMDALREREGDASRSRAGRPAKSK